MKKKTHRQKRPTGVRKLTGYIQKNPKGFAFLVLDDHLKHEFEDIYIGAAEAHKLLPGDRVEMTLDSRDNVLGHRILSHQFRSLLGIYKDGKILVRRRKFTEFFPVSVGSHRIPPDSWVLCDLEPEQKRGMPRFKVVKVFGEVPPASEDIQIIASEFNLIEAHSEKSKEEARKWLENENFKGPGRRDLTQLPFCTIDGEDARDFDDAILVKKNADGYKLSVAIADVSYYVTKGSALDREARERGTSVYFPERAFHMLPTELSEHLCSLRPLEPKYALVAEMDLDAHGNLKKTKIYEATIKSHRRWTYNELEKERVSRENDSKWDFFDAFKLYRILHRARVKRGSLDFDFPEAKVLLGSDQEPIDIFVQARLDTHRLIEEFMILANEAVSEWASHHKMPFVFRVHEPPSAVSLVKFKEFSESLAVPFEFKKISPKQLSDYLKTIESHPAKDLLQTMLLRSLKQAAYFTVNGGHFGLASNAYTHFTSPIRRYPDLIVHRLLKNQIKSKRPFDHSVEHLDEMTQHCNYRERLATEADREAIRLKQSRMMLKHLGDVFPGKISGLNAKGLFIQFEKPFVEGFLPADEIESDGYVYKDSLFSYVSQRRGKRIRMGDAFSARVVRVALDERRVYLAKAP